MEGVLVTRKPLPIQVTYQQICLRTDLRILVARRGIQKTSILLLCWRRYFSLTVLPLELEL